jgi:hypothetical protein
MQVTIPTPPTDPTAIIPSPPIIDLEATLAEAHFHRQALDLTTTKRRRKEKEEIPNESDIVEV